jgi:hypothetical protein
MLRAGIIEEGSHLSEAWDEFLGVQYRSPFVLHIVKINVYSERVQFWVGICSTHSDPKVMEIRHQYYVAHRAPRLPAASSSTQFILNACGVERVGNVLLNS